MSMIRFSVATLFVLASLAPSPAAAQATHARVASAEILAPRFDSSLQLALAVPNPSADAAPAALLLPKYGAWVGITKWVSLTAAVGLGTAGALINRDANEIFDRLDALCRENPQQCRSRNPDGSYSDRQLEQMYQDVVSKDRQARAAFIGAEVAFGASVVLFIVDFQKSRGPKDKPYHPEGEEKSALRLTALPSELALRYYFK